MRKRRINQDFVKEGALEMQDEDLEQASDKQKEIERKIAQSGLLRKYVTVSKYMFLMLNDYRKGNYKEVPWLTICTLVFTLLYILNPLDLVPDFIPVIGYIDDVTVFALGLNFVKKDLKRYLKWRDKGQAFRAKLLD